MENMQRVMLEGMKFAVANLQLMGISPKEVMAQSIVYLLELYGQEENLREISEKKEYLLDKALLTIRAYIEMGFSYISYEELFEEVFQKAGMTEDEVLSFKRRSAEKLNPGKSSIGMVLGKWNPVYHSGNKKDVIEDILRKIRNQEVGEYFYYTKQNHSERMNVFQLVVQEECSYLCLLNEQKYYEINTASEGR